MVKKADKPLQKWPGSNRGGEQRRVRNGRGIT